jgi:hypothetical protein
MNDDELRLLVRAAIQRHLATAPVESAAARGPDTLTSISFAQYRFERADDDTMCIIEPAVRCNHCGFCKCHGH